MEPGSLGSIADLDRWLADRHLAGSWSPGSANDERAGAPPYPPFLWKWAEIHHALTRIGPAMDRDPALAARMAGYKHFGFEHPGMPPGVAPTINMGAQVLSPGEHGEARRHTQAEFRFILKGHTDAYAVVEGERFPMEEGDLIGTPAWAWYDWANEGTEPVFWLNVGDITLTRLSYRFRDVHPEGRQPIDKPPGYWARVAAPARPTGIPNELPTTPFRYRWADTDAALRTLSGSVQNADPFDGYQIMYPHPLTGGPTSPTLAFEAQLLLPGFKGEAHRHTSTTRYHVILGQGVSEVDGHRLEWGKGDCFIVPPWAGHSHANVAGERAILLSISDRPIMQALELYREAPARGGRAS